MKCKRIMTLVVALACVVVWVLPGAVVPVSAATTFYCPNPGSGNATTEHDIYIDNLASGATGPFLKYSWPLFSESSWTKKAHRYFYVNKNNSVYDSQIAYTDKSVTVSSSSKDDYYISCSFLKGPAVYNNADSVFEIPVLLDGDSGSYYHFSDMVLNVHYSYHFSSVARGATFYLYWYDEDFNLIDFHSQFIVGMSGVGSQVLDKALAIPSGAVYFDFYILLGFSDLVDGFDYTFTLDDMKASFYANPPETKPNIPSDPDNSGDDSGSTSLTVDLSGVESRLDGVESGISGIQGDIDALESTVSSEFAEVREDIGALHTEILMTNENLTNEINAMESEISNGLDDLGTSISGDFDALGESIDTGLGEVEAAIGVSNTKLQSVIDGILGLPKKILDGIVGLFVPSEEDLQAYNDKWNELLRTRFGALYESVDLISSYGEAFSEVEATNTVTFPSVTIPLAGVDFSFGGWDVKVIPEGFEGVFSMLSWVISILATLAFVNALRNKFERLLGDV